MSYTVIAPNGSATFVLTANQKIAVKSLGEARVSQLVGFPNYPDQGSTLQLINNATWTSSAFASGGTVLVQAGPLGAVASVGTNPVISDSGNWQLQADPPQALNITGALTASLMLGGIVTSTTGAAVTATPPTGALLDEASGISIGESFNFSVINTGGNSFTISVGGGVSGFTIGKGSMVVATVTSGLFRCVKTAAATYTLHRLS